MAAIMAAAAVFRCGCNYRFGDAVVTILMGSSGAVAVLASYVRQVGRGLHASEPCRLAEPNHVAGNATVLSLRGEPGDAVPGSGVRSPRPIIVFSVVATRA